MSAEILEQLVDLRVQATTERSHYYVASTVTAAIAEVERLREALHKYGNHTATCRLMTALRNLPNLNSCTCGWEDLKP